MKTPPNLTERQLAALKFIHDCVATGLPPTFAEVGQVLQVSKQAAAVHIEALEEKGCITRLPRSPRYIRLTKTGLRLSRRATATSSDVSVAHGRSA